MGTALGGTSMTLAEATALGASCRADVAALPAGRYDFEHFDLNRKTNFWGNLELVYDSNDLPHIVAASTTQLPGYTGVVFYKTRADGLVSMMQVAADHAHQETGASTSAPFVLC
jgi:hypothetical protein